MSTAAKAIRENNRLTKAVITRAIKKSSGDSCAFSSSARLSAKTLMDAIVAAVNICQIR